MAGDVLNIVILESGQSFNPTNGEALLNTIENKQQ
jgi:hypothetical protein